MCVRLPELSEAAAESALAKLWCRLEARGLRSPKLHVTSAENGKVQVSMPFVDPATASAAVESWTEEGQQQFSNPTKAERKSVAD
jgi:hypothetical protein